jgi:hypothetical protein
MCKAAGRILIDDETLKRLPLNIACYASATEPLKLKGIQAGQTFYSFEGSILPTTASDIHDETLFIVENYMKQALGKYLADQPIPQSNLSNSIKHSLPARATLRTEEVSAIDMNRLSLSEFGSERIQPKTMAPTSATFISTKSQHYALLQSRQSFGGSDTSHTTARVMAVVGTASSGIHIARRWDLSYTQ